ncbi:MAG: hypothetical protein COA94_08250 [Rickettsiales bacterium]|nr:MAG: hypothetical protein COA94_08250 [Rickettsiales bacterium]
MEPERLSWIKMMKEKEMLNLSKLTLNTKRNVMEQKKILMHHILPEMLKVLTKPSLKERTKSQFSKRMVMKNQNSKKNFKTTQLIKR